MKNQSFLTFSLYGMLFGIETNAVSEIIWLPELTLIEESPSFIPGIINMRGQIIPVMDLAVRFGHKPQRYNLSDRVIILKVSEFNSKDHDRQDLTSALSSGIEMIGIIVNEVFDVISIQQKDIEPPPFDKTGQESNTYFIRGQAKTGQKIIMIIDPGKFFDKESGIEKPDIETREIIPKTESIYFCPEADQNEKEIFHNRAINLQQVSDADDAERIIPAAVVSLNNEYFCVELESVREFSKIYNFTHVPCCPLHIAGNMNLRGNVLTVIDISALLNLQAGSIRESTKVIIADSGEFPVGVIVDEILDVIYLKERDIVPSGSSVNVQNEKFFKGTAPYGSRMMAVLNLKEILLWDGLIVNEEA